MAINVAINGFGRIGMLAAKIISKRDDVNLVAINATGSAEMVEYLLKYDSVHGVFPDVELVNEKLIRIAGKDIILNSTRDPKECDFGDAEVVIECTGAYLTIEKAKEHIRGNVKKVIMSAPAKDDTPTFVLGVNHDLYAGQSIISNASCTTNCLAPVAKVLNDEFGINAGLMTTIHSYTNDQNVLDVKHKKDFRRARAAAINMIPTSTGAAKAVGLVIPELQGKMNGFAVRVPTPNVSVVDLTVTLEKDATKDSINNAMRKAAETNMKGLILIDDDKRVSSDFIGCPYSSIFVSDTTQVVGTKMAKILAWYDNEWGYSERLVDMAVYISK